MASDSMTVVEFLIFRAPKPPVTMDTSPSCRMPLTDESKLLDETDSRIGMAIFNYGPDRVQLLRDGEPLGQLGPADGTIVTGGGRIDARTVEG
jgi:hypothetical protein